MYDEVPTDEVPVDDVPAVDDEVPVDDELPIDDEDGDSVPDEDEPEEGVLLPAVGGGAGALAAPLMGLDPAVGGALGAGTASLFDDETEDEGVEQEENLDLEAVIRELESELSEGEDDEEGEEDEEVVDSEAPVEESDEVEEEYEIDETALEEDENEDLTAEEVEALYHIANSSVNELAEYKEAVHFLKDKLHEVNILNAKLLYTNKLFKEYSLDNNQKLKVVETFDRAQTTREIKLVFSTIAEQLNENTGVPKRKPIKESASAPVKSTKPSQESQKVITEENQVADRFRKLAGLLKG